MRRHLPLDPGTAQIGSHVTRPADGAIASRTAPAGQIGSHVSRAGTVRACPDDPNLDQPNPDQPNPDQPNPDQPNPDQHCRASPGAADGASQGRTEPHGRLRDPGGSLPDHVPAVRGVDGDLVALCWSYGADHVAGRQRTAYIGLLVLTAIILTGKTVVAFVSQSTFFYFLQPIITDGVVAATFLLSLATARPMVARLAGDFYPMDAELSLRPRMRRLFWHLTAMWAFVCLAKAVAMFSGAELPLARHLRAGEEHLDAGVQPLRRGPHRLRCRPRRAQGGTDRRRRHHSRWLPDAQTSGHREACRNPSDWLLTQPERGNPATRLDDRHPGEQAWSRATCVRPLIHGATCPADAVRTDRATRAGDLVFFTDWQGDATRERLTGEPGSEVSEVLGRADERGVDDRGLCGAGTQRHRIHVRREPAPGAHPAEARRRGDPRHACPHRRMPPPEACSYIRHQDDPTRDIAYVGGIDLCHSRRDDAAHGGDPQALDNMSKEYGDTPPWHDHRKPERPPTTSRRCSGSGGRTPPR